MLETGSIEIGALVELLDYGYTLNLSSSIPCVCSRVSWQLGGEGSAVEQFDIGDMAFDTTFEHDYDEVRNQSRVLNYFLCFFEHTTNLRYVASGPTFFNLFVVQRCVCIDVGGVLARYQGLCLKKYIHVLFVNARLA